MGPELIIAPIAILMIFGGLPLIVFYFINKTKTSKIDALVKIVELGGKVDEETMKMLNDGGGNHKTDYRSGLIWLAIGLPLALGIWMENGMGEAVFGTIPVFVGIAYLISGKFRLRESD